MKNNLYSKMSVIDYVHIITKFLVSNDKNLYKNSQEPQYETS